MHQSHHKCMRHVGRVRQQGRIGSLGSGALSRRKHHMAEAAEVVSDGPAKERSDQESRRLASDEEDGEVKGDISRD